MLKSVVLGIKYGECVLQPKRQALRVVKSEQFFVGTRLLMILMMALILRIISHGGVERVHPSSVTNFNDFANEQVPDFLLSSQSLLYVHMCARVCVCVCARVMLHVCLLVHVYVRVCHVACMCASGVEQKKLRRDRAILQLKPRAKHGL